ncbi:MAG TPA: hypothetical protein ENJ21_02290 [Chromatiaceae bacterium]|nr:hypothetical protein [Chromatiaceae bacterium]
MYSRFLGGLLLLAAGSLQAGHPPWPLEIIERFDSAKVVVYAKEDDIAASPEWRPADGAPPFTLADLLKSVAQWQARLPAMANSTIHTIELKPIAHHEQQNRWYYLVQLKDKPGARHPTHYVGVLLSGKVLPVIEEPAAIK